MKILFKLSLIALMTTSIVYGQLRDYRTHTRGMLWETVFNTGEIGRAYDDGEGGSRPEFHSMEWPGNSAFKLDNVEYHGFWNAFGGGVWLGADTGRVGNRKFFKMEEGDIVTCGFVTDDGGRAITVEGKYSFPISIEKKTNFPVNDDGSINESYDPFEAEEIIVAQWDTPLGVTVTRTSRAWSFPDYDDFIIFEYEMENTGNRLPATASYDTLYEMTVVFGYTHCPSMVAYQRQYGKWDYFDMRSEEMYGRFDLKRWLWYGHTRNGKPDPLYYEQWGESGEYGGGLTAPGSVGFMTLYYDHEHLSKFNRTPKTRFYVNRTDGIDDHKFVWDKKRGNGSGYPAFDAKMKQPYLTRVENTKMQNPGRGSDWLDGKVNRKTSPFIPGRLNSKGQLYQDTSKISSYWFGRSKMVVAQAYTQACAKVLGFGPYALPPGEKLRFTIAEVAGYGPGLASDSIYDDYGGGTGDFPNEYGPYFHPVPSWYDTLTYPFLNKIEGLGMGSDYLQKYDLPEYVNSDVVSMRQVADRAIQMYKGGAVVKHDTLQYEPLDSPPTGNYEPLSIPFPSPAITVAGEGLILSKITWGPQVESVTNSTPGFQLLNAPFDHYEVLRANHAIGPWTVLEEMIVPGDARYFNSETNQYEFEDETANLNTTYYYAVLSVDESGEVGGLTNLTKHEAQYSSVNALGKVYAAPNPFIVSSGYADDADKLGIYGLPEKATIKIYSYSGQLVETIEHDAPKFSTAWLQISRNNQWIASGVYYFTVEDISTGDKTWGKFVIIH